VRELLAWTLALGGLLGVARAQAQSAGVEWVPEVASASSAPARGLLSPSPGKPVRALPGDSFSFEVRTATALTPPPGIQEPRAHRAFHVWLCAEGIPLAGPARLCFPLSVLDLRPLDSHGLGYRVKVGVPAWLAPGDYDLGVRFPGGSHSVPGGVVVAEPAEAHSRGERERASACDVRVEAAAVGGGWTLRGDPCPQGGNVRIHLGTPSGLTGARALDAYPMPGPAGGFAQGAVLWVGLSPGVPLTLRPSTRPFGGADRPSIEAHPSPLGDRVEFTLQHPPPDSRVYWQLSPWESGVGPRASMRYQGGRAASVSAVVLAPDGATALLTADVSGLARPGHAAAGCQLAGQGGQEPVTGLLFWALSRKLGRRRRRPLG
jgi:hypothetical protein